MALKRNQLAAVFLCLVAACLLVQIAEAGKKKKLAKAILKGAIAPKPHYGGGYHRRGPSFPVWGIILIVVLLTGSIGFGVLLFCFLRRSSFQSCMPRQQFV